ncbi:LysR family transcriptional regulator [Sediminicoccus sp. BL-A-41-H5]|uniref:LysR family transcriptional regulator n=1 Tax=Sediminicoccus sp. BL-A-41-H5 TaxID=3421106 RepID=UPI003D67CC81
MDALTLDQFTVFVAIAEAGSFAGAARRLGRAQSAVTYAVQKLEEQTGLPLFDRSAYRPVLSEAGRALLPRARRVVEDVAAYRRQAAGIAQGVEPELTVALSSLAPLVLVTPALGRLHAGYPGVQLRLLIQPDEQATASLAEGEADLALALDLPGLPAWAERIPITDLRMVFVAAREHPLARLDGPLSPEVLGEHLQVAVSVERAARRGRDHGVVGINRWYVQDVATKLALLRAGLGWGSMPRALVEEDLAAGRMVLLDAAAAWRDRPPALLAAIHHRERPPGPAARAFVAGLQAA